MENLKFRDNVNYQKDGKYDADTHFQYLLNKAEAEAKIPKYETMEERCEKGDERSCDRPYGGGNKQYITMTGDNRKRRVYVDAATKKKYINKNHNKVFLSSIKGKYKYTH